MIRTLTRPSTANCTLPLYVGFLLSEPNATSCCRLSSLLNISHDSVNRFLNRESYSPKDMFDEVKPTINLRGGVLSVDDTVLDKPYSNYMGYVGYYWSGKHHAVVKGINLITLYYTDSQGQNQPVNFRIYDKKLNKTKNDYFLEMLAEVLSWGIKPSFVTTDSWYSCVKNLKTIKNNQIGFCVALESNRFVSVERGSEIQIKDVEIAENGTVVWLREFGYVKVFRTHLKNQVRHYAIYLPKNNDDANDENNALNHFEKMQFEKLHDQHWQIEQYHRTIKQVCNIESFQVRSKTAVSNHIFSAICGYVKLQKMRATDVIKNCYGLQRNLFNEVIASCIKSISLDMEHMNSKYHGAINA
jgi:Transposase DDE domain